MVLCKFFQQGSCRFGSKCANEHLDVKQMVKADVEAAIHGKQWPLSTYGPFRDKPSIPNFIEDQSFEEVRLLCYEAKQKNFFEQFHQQFTKEVLEASNKMNALLQMTPDVVDVLIKVHDVPTDTSIFGAAGAKSTNSANNPFGFANSNSNPGSIFSKSSTNTTSNNLFTNKTAYSATNQATSGLFSNSSMFATQQQTSVFAQPTPAASNSIFAVGNNNNGQQNVSIFAQQQNPSNMFAAASQQQQPTNSNGLFSQQNPFTQQAQQSSNIFRQALQPSQPQQGLFAQAAQTIQQQQQQQGLFAQAAQQAASQNLFATAPQQTQNIFSQALQQQQQTGSNIFQQNSTGQQQPANSNIFQQNQPIANSQHIQTPQSPAGAFQAAVLQTQNSIAPINNQPQPSLNLYSRLEDLMPDEIEAFKADCFVPGKIPFNPPPRELIN